MWKPSYDYENPDFKLISHRGNVTGPCEYENNPEYIKETLNDGFDVELDVWFNGITEKREYFTGLYLGHDKPQYKIDFEFLQNERIWAHAKNAEALDAMLAHKNIHCFWHQTDDYTLTSKGFVWTFPNKRLLSNSIAVCVTEKPSVTSQLRKACAGVCSDFLK